MAADSVGASAEITVIRKEPKIFWNQDYLIGFVGSFKLGQVVKFCDLPEFPKILRHEKFAEKFAPGNFADRVEKFFVKEFVPALEDAAEAGGLSAEETSESCLMIGIAEHLYLIESNLQVGSYVHDYAAIGVAEQAGLTGLDVADRAGIEDPLERLSIVASSIETHSIYIKKPWYVARTDELNTVKLL